MSTTLLASNVLRTPVIPGAHIRNPRGLPSPPGPPPPPPPPRPRATPRRRQRDDHRRVVQPRRPRRRSRVARLHELADVAGTPQRTGLRVVEYRHGRPGPRLVRE